MCEALPPHEPENLAKDMILCAKLIRQGSKATDKRLAKAKKGTYCTIETPDDCNNWWNDLKDGKKKDKTAMLMMAYQYPRLAGHLNMSQSKVLELETKTKSQEDEIKLLKLKLHQWKEETKSQEVEIKLLTLKLHQWKEETKSQVEEITSLKLELQQYIEENTRLNDKMSKRVLKLQSTAGSQKQEINSLKSRVHEQEIENEQLKDEIDNYQTLFDSSEYSLKLSGPANWGSRWQRSRHDLLQELPDLQNDNSNYEFWAKIKNWLSKGEVDPRCAFKLLQLKCPLKVWQAIEKNFCSKNLTEKAFSNPAMLARLWENLWRWASEALGSGTKYFERYYYQKQEVGETFEEYAEKKFTLYCSYGVDKVEPDKNDQHFLHNVIQNAAKRYQDICPKSYIDLLTKAMLIDRRIMEIEYNNECSNCFKKGHTRAMCRRPGGDNEVGPNQCYSCEGYNHWARDCWVYKQGIRNIVAVKTRSQLCQIEYVPR